ncbi:MAG: NADH-quinone oxidoreductase subunit L [Chromatiales bacterium 21-64-14]|nr:MAG: NADH-quinone oxidoreductase subunit L [Chromatiales bacterium 21-64-14]
MNSIAFTILGPLAGVAAILLVRRAPAALALLGAAVGLGASVWLLAGLSAGAPFALVLPGLPGYPLRLIATPLSGLLAVVVATVGAFVLVYAVGYMKEDPEPVRFFATMSFFVAAMQTLVLAGDWVLLLAAWELIGLSSYLLIGFWHARPGVGSAAMRAFLYTRTADLGLYTAVFLLIAHTGTSAIAPGLAAGGPVASVAGVLLLVAAMGKSAQTPLQDWLQRAMAGPTPVSALLHSATLVAAGAILLIRVAPMLGPDVLLAVGLVGGVTTVVTGLIALGERDLKRLLAASTSSQYGLMLVAIGAGAPVAALVHLTAHAAIKSSLFLGAGVFQHARGSTAFPELAGTGRAHPRTFLGFAIAGLALAGIPPLSGFFTKDAIIGASLAASHAGLLAPLALAGTLLTGAYVARALRILWRGNGRERRVPGIGWMGAGLAGLVVLAAGLGGAVAPIGAWLGVPIPGSRLALVLGLSAALGGLGLGWFIPGVRLLGPLRRSAEQGFAIAGGLDFWIARPALALARACDRLERALYAGVLAVGGFGLALARGARFSDERGIDGLIFGLARRTRALGERARALQSGLVHRELALAAAGAALMLAALVAGLVRF